jgi:hypothetical protein
MCPPQAPTIPYNLDLPRESYGRITKTCCFGLISGEKTCMSYHFVNISLTGSKFGPETLWSVEA